MQLLRRLTSYFEQKKYIRNQVVYTQGVAPDMVYVVYEGEFEVVRRKVNKITAKQKHFDTVRLLNDHRKAPENLKV